MVSSDSISEQTPLTTTNTNFDKNDDFDVFYDAIDPEEQEEVFYDSLDYFEKKESGKKQTSCSNIGPIQVQKSNSDSILAEKRSFDSIIEEDKAVVSDSPSDDAESKRLQKKLKVASKSDNSSDLSLAAMSEYINSSSNKTISISQDNSSKNDDEENKNSIPPTALSGKRKLEHVEQEEPTSSNSLQSSKLYLTSPSSVSSSEKPPKKTKVTSKSRSSFVDNLRATINKNAPKTRPGVLRRVAAFRSEVRLTMPYITEKQAFCGFQNEATICQTDAQLFVLDKRQRWKKRGSGTIVLDKDDDQARLVMLDDTTFRSIFNVKLFFGMEAYVADNNCINVDAFNTVHDIYGRPEVKLVRYSLKVDNSHHAKGICDHVNSQTPSSPATIPKKVLHDAINKDVCSIISSLMPKKNPWKL